MMQVDYANVAIICQQVESAIELDSKQLAGLCQVYRVIVESGRRKKSALGGQRADPSQGSIGIENDRRVIAASGSVENIIITQAGAARPGLKFGWTVVATALIVETGGRDRGDSLL